MVADPENDTVSREAAAASLRTFMRLSVSERSTVILMDVLGYSQREVGAVLDVSIPSVKASLHRGRSRLRALALEPDDRPAPGMSERERSLLSAYVDRFNARDFDAIRDMLADGGAARPRGQDQDVRPFGGRHLSRQLFQDAMTGTSSRASSTAGRRRSPANPGPRPDGRSILSWSIGADGEILGIRDFRYARYVCESAELTLLDH